ncbi:DEKNAAC102854 [Brettanomyces naardenensis]|uniref:DEKNAAC102854 n=1 Tax=Brettanomyces naardenensis TaxID=13370 RepID=A0A448YLY4_BRENA|nr:DEKNAAC102854 [Brettanomyces naardenensis]
MTGPITGLLYRLNKGYLNFSDLVVGVLFDPLRDIVLITGGGSGLGKELASKFRSKKATVVVFDIKPPEEGTPDFVQGVTYVNCDVSDREAVLEKAEWVKQNVGVVTMLINNAGITMGKSLLELSFDEIETSLQVNLLSSFYTIKAFLPEMLNVKRGYIITVASTLGYLSPARLSAYGAAKSGLIALHESLTYELGPPAFNTTGVKTLLLCPGQLRTGLFQGVRTPSTLLAPELDPKDVANTLYKSVRLGKRGEMKMPLYGNLIPLVRSVPWPLAELARYLSGMDQSMKKFVGNAVTISEKSAASLNEAASIISSMLPGRSTSSSSPAIEEISS